MSAGSSAISVRSADGRDRVRALQRVLYRSAKQDPERRFHALFDKVARNDVMWRAWNDVRANKGAPGVDGLSIEDVEALGVQEFLEELAAGLMTGRYRPQPLRRVHIPKPGRPGQTRPLGIPTVADRVVMAAARLVLEPVFEADFLASSFGFRPKRSAHMAVEAIRVGANRRNDWVLDADIKACLWIVSIPFCGVGATTSGWGTLPGSSRRSTAMSTNASRSSPATSTNSQAANGSAALTANGSGGLVFTPWAAT